MKISTMLSLVKTSSQRKIEPRRDTDIHFGGANHTNNAVISLTYGQIPVKMNIKTAISLPPLLYVLIVFVKKEKSRKWSMMNLDEAGCS
jgi:hypothetical protein